MFDEKVLKVINFIRRLTEEGKIEWKYSNSDTSFKLELDSATLVVSYSADDPFAGGQDSLSLIMYNGTGKPIDLAFARRNDNSDDYELLWNLFCEAKESTNKKNATLENIINELELKDLPF